MVSRLNPVTIEISFPRQTYSLGDTVSVRVDITAQTDVTVREARIGMECQIAIPKFVPASAEGTPSIVAGEREEC